MKPTLQSSNLAWHYTSLGCARIIESFKALKPRDFFLVGGDCTYDRPILWFSKNQFWEPSANKVALEDDRLRTLSTDEMLAGGVVRYGVSQSTLTPFVKINRKAGATNSAIEFLIDRGIEQGANPEKDWLGTFKKIHLEDCVSIQVFNSNSREWVDFSLELDKKTRKAIRTNWKSTLGCW